MNWSAPRTHSPRRASAENLGLLCLAITCIWGSGPATKWSEYEKNGASTRIDFQTSVLTQSRAESSKVL